MQLRRGPIFLMRVDDPVLLRIVDWLDANLPLRMKRGALVDALGEPMHLWRPRINYLETLEVVEVTRTRTRSGVHDAAFPGSVGLAGQPANHYAWHPGWSAAAWREHGAWARACRYATLDSARVSYKIRPDRGLAAELKQVRRTNRDAWR